MYKFLPTTKDHIEELIENLRDEDRAEVNALADKKSEILIWETFDKSIECWTAIAPEGVMCIFGVARPTVLSEMVVPWMLTTNVVENHKKTLVKGTKIALDYWKNKYEWLENYVDASYKKAIRWAEKSGFTVHPAEPFGPYGKPFCRIEMRK